MIGNIFGEPIGNCCHNTVSLREPSGICRECWIGAEFVQLKGLRKVARQLGVDPSNLRRKIR